MPQQAPATPKQAPNNKPNTSQHGAESRSKIGPKSTPERPRIDPKSMSGRFPTYLRFLRPFLHPVFEPQNRGGASWNFTQYFFTDFSTSSAILDPNISPIWSQNRCRNGAPKGAETEEGVGIRFVLVCCSFCKHVCLEFSSRFACLGKFHPKTRKWQKSRFRLGENQIFRFSTLARSTLKSITQLAK